MADHQYENHVQVPNPTQKDTTAFPANRESKGKQRFGPAPRPEGPTVNNENNDDRHGTATPWKAGS